MDISAWDTTSRELNQMPMVYATALSVYMSVYLFIYYINVPIDNTGLGMLPQTHIPTKSVIGFREVTGDGSRPRNQLILNVDEWPKNKTQNKNKKYLMKPNV